MLQVPADDANAGRDRVSDTFGETALAAEPMRFVVARDFLSIMLSGLTAATIAAVTSPAIAGDDIHKLVERFALESERAEKARAEATERAAADARAADEQRKATDARKIEAQRRSAELKRKAEAARREAERLKADEAEMLQRARAEAEERRLEQERNLAEIEQAEREKEAAEAAQKAAVAKARLETEREAQEAQRAANEAEAKRIARQQAEEASRKADAERAAREAEARRVVEENAKAELARIAEAKRVAEEKRHADELAAAEARRKDEERKAAEAARIAEDKRIAEARRIEEERAAAEAAARLAADREAEKRELAERMKRAQEARAASDQAKSDQSQPTAPVAGATRPAQQPATLLGANPTTDTRVTVLIIMDAGDRGIRRVNKTADPMLCVGDSCYLSRGAGEDARRISRVQAFGPGIALGSRADACNNQLDCVFRNVDLEAARAQIQPVDLRIVRHDRREATEVTADPTCRMEAGRLACSRIVLGKDYRMWIVPERIAREAGAEALLVALRGAFAEQRRAEAGR